MKRPDSPENQINQLGRIKKFFYLELQNFKQLEFEEKEINYQLNKSKLIYAISIVDKLISSKDSKKINNDLHLVWKISGFNSKKMFENSFKLHKGISLYDYCKKLNPNCDCNNRI